MENKKNNNIYKQIHIYHPFPFYDYLYIFFPYDKIHKKEREIINMENNRKDTKTEKLFLIVMIFVFILLLSLAEKPKNEQNRISGKSEIITNEKSSK